jgi:ribosomal protein L4
VPYRLFGRPRQKTRGELDHVIERGGRMIAGPKTA